METTMNKRYNLKICVLFALLLSIPVTQAMAQQADTLTVPWLDGNNLAVNSLYDAIVGDTLADGSRANLNRVYKLEQGGFYYITERLENNGFPLRIVGEAGDPTDALKNPPIIQLEHREDGSRSDKIIAAGGDVELKNLIINGKTTLGDLPYEILVFNASDSRYIIDNVIFEYAAWGILGFYGRDSEIYIRNSKFRNLHSPNQPWGGRGLSVWTDMEKVHIENNTFFHIGGFAVQVEGGVARELWINQNTFVNVGRQPILHSWHKNSFFTNNLIVNGWWHGEGSEGFNAIRLGQEDNQFSGMLMIDELPTRYGLEIERVVVVSNNSNYTDPEIDAFFQSTSSNPFPLRKQPFVNVRTQNYADQFDNIIIQNTFDGPNPGLVTHAKNFDEMIAFINAIRNEASVIPSYYWDPGRDSDNYSIQWPLPENLSYSNATHRSAAIGGFPLGDLNWFPDRKAAWELEKDALAAQIKNIAGEPPVFTNMGTFEAETGDVSGGAEVKAMDNRLHVRIEATGNLNWTFDLDEAGTYDVVIKKRSWWETVNPQRTTNLVVNGGATVAVQAGTNLVEGTPQQWAVPKVEGVTFVAGQNTLALNKNWGYLEYERVTIQTSTGEVVKTLWPAKSVLTGGGEYLCSGSNCASGDEYVDISSGSLTLSVDLESSGDYILLVTGILLDGESASAEVTVNGTSAGSVNYSGNVGATTIFSLEGVQLNNGNNTVVFSGATGSLGIDIVGFTLIGQPVSVERPDRFAGFALNQNYPNPFNPSTSISFALPEMSDVKLTVYNILGQQVAVLTQGIYSAGMHTINFNSANLASGTYIYRLEAGNFVQVRKMLLLK